ncbi:MAG: serine hydrolase domain-containing protein, partial [Steroidobacteraceae bacterium]
MNRTRLVTFCVILLGLGAGCGHMAPASIPQACRSGAADIERQITTTIGDEVKGGFSGAVLVAQGECVLVDDVYGSLNGKRVSPQDRYLIASMAKQFTSTSLLVLQERGLVDLDDPISRYLTDVPADKREITIRQLLSHSSGLPSGYYDSESATSWQEAARVILKLPLSAAPGEKFQYSSENYQLGVALMEARSGRRYPEFVHKELLVPVGLHDTGQLEGPASVAKLSPTIEPLPPRMLNIRWGGWGYYSTTRDLYSWYRAIRSGKVLNRQSVAELFQPLPKMGEGHATLGWFVGATASGEERVLTRGNDEIGSVSVIYAYPRTDTVII